ncbi:MAG: META domain-containing protein [Candidatus Pseudobacter hemicellulosilyticus]|uniref:META domain-containing protein n=1 Tax=Candidatus Pseudobacter hemicellulosilyticus TaxID=3121375 RepID=A0AAJ5WWG9_9BACT|nr:MAG: META domain-containing protein [Pseudobacter sp.]
MRVLLIIAACSLLLLAARPATHKGNLFSDQPVAANPTKDSGLTGKWYLLPVLPSDTATGNFPTITFHPKRKTFSGNSGCNDFNGSYSFTDTTIHFGENMRMTKMICTGFNEAAFMKSLLSANRYVLEDTVLILLFDATELSRWTRKPSREPVIKKA